MKILKHTLNQYDCTPTLEVPKDSQVLKVAEQNRTLVVWVQIPDDPADINKNFDAVDVWRFLILGTGDFVEDTTIAEYSYLDTVQMSSGLVWHVFIQWSHSQ